MTAQGGPGVGPIRKMDPVRPTLAKQGATPGANRTIVCGLTVGRYAFVGAGAVVNRNVGDHGLVVGNPGKRIGWVCKWKQSKRLDLNQDGTPPSWPSGLIFAIPIQKRETFPPLSDCILEGGSFKMVKIDSVESTGRSYGNRGKCPGSSAQGQGFS